MSPPFRSHIPVEHTQLDLASFGSALEVRSTEVERNLERLCETDLTGASELLSRDWLPSRPMLPRRC